jgi:hypothetical protein
MTDFPEAPPARQLNNRCAGIKKRGPKPAFQISIEA